MTIWLSPAATSGLGQMAGGNLAGDIKEAKRILLVALLSLAVCLVMLHPWAQAVLTLPGALRQAAKTSMPADAARFDLTVSREESAQIGASYYPRISFDGAYVNLDNPPFFKAGPITFPSGNQTFYEYKLAVRQLIWDGGRRSTALEASRSRESAIDLAGQGAVCRIQASVAERFVTVLSLRAQRGVIDLRRKALADYLRVVKDLYDQGIVARNDLLRTEVALRSVGDQASSLEEACATALEALNKDLGLPPTEPQSLPEALPPPPPLPWDEATCRSRSTLQNQGVLALEEKVKALDQAAELKRRDYYPNLVAEASHSYQQNDYLLYPTVNSLFLGISVDIFDGGAKAAKVRQAKAEADKARRELDEARRGASLASGQALRDFQEALREVETARTNVLASEENLRIVEDQYKEGLSRTTDVLDAESVLAESRWRVIRMHYEAYARQAALLAAMGEDLAAFYESAALTAPQEKTDGR